MPTLMSKMSTVLRKEYLLCPILFRLNSNVKVIPLHMHADSASLQKLVATNTYNVVIDGTDNVATRYLLNDLCVLNKLPLVSGSALRMEGQLTVYNYKGGPCYRCLFPKPPPPETVTSCGDGGVLGVSKSFITLFSNCVISASF